ncbi:TetR/AcrR family transcriptional regulator [Streptomyces spectabilis]|uniref:TetR/AcrR family transcriptional regulator n=1 Tax=Streptomyces spectabilis TaxID=68270 RepID=A0A516RFK7_STRST|nr:TetR/AcrR family transcriptional regulator C-terminal domain-containing protein [Streptomyces spectabilis]QDQ14433.1 TetR/AcrR family transcriptional regulator [Streptomyces spectabilis]
MSGTTRRRPTHRKGRATLTRESVGEAALAYLGRHGAAALTMRSLAADLGVSARALYNYVEDRRDLVAVAAEIFQAGWRPPRLDPAPGAWRAALGAFCDDLRAHYRRHPGMTTLALSENVTMAGHPAMLRNVDALIGFYGALGLTLADAYRACMETVRLVVGFVEFEDALRDRPPAHLDPADLAAHPPPWLRAEEADGLPHLAAVAELEPDSADTRFAFAVDVLAAGIDARRRTE